MFTKVNRHEKHVILWNALAQTGSRNKVYTFNRLFPSEKLLNSKAYQMSCWACAESGEDCSRCPLTWGEDGEDCMDEGTLYYKWIQAEGVEERKVLAALIRDLPWKEV